MGKTSGNVGNVFAEPNRFRTSRRGPQNTRAQDRRHARQLGEVLHSWNRAHGALFLLFQKLAADGDYELAIGLWHAVRSDSTQRDMVNQAALVKLKTRKSILNGITWAVSALNAIAMKRNDITHSEMLCYFDATSMTQIMEPGISVRPQVAERLRDFPLENEWRKITGDLNAIGEYLLDIYLALNWTKSLGH